MRRPLTTNIPIQLRNVKRTSNLFFWLIKELKNQIPGFDPFNQDRILLANAYKDLKTFLKIKKKLAEKKPIESKAFLKVWVSQWLTKWRQRVSIFQRKLKQSKHCQKCKIRAQKYYRKMKNKKDLRDMVIRKLINNGEVCMPDTIAKNLIINEIARHYQKSGSRESDALNLLEILNRLTLKIKRLKKEKGPLLHLRYKTKGF
jgi:hypothetical protein